MNKEQLLLLLINWLDQQPISEESQAIYNDLDNEYAAIYAAKARVQADKGFDIVYSQVLNSLN